MITDTIQTTAEAIPEDTPSAARVMPYTWERSGYYGITASSGRQPRWHIALRAPEGASPTFARVKADYKALTQQIDREHTTRLEAISRRWSSGDLTPNQRSEELATATQEYAIRGARIEAAFAGLDEEATLQRARLAVERAIAETWTTAMAAHDTTGTDGPTAA